MENHLSFWLFVVLFLFSCEGKDLNNGEGVIKGKISIGPLCPVETIPPSPECLPTADTYKAWQTAVWTLNHTKIADLNADLQGNFMLGLGSGTYLIDFVQSRTGSIGSSNLPAVIRVADKDILVFNINIDTGIR
mgnify:CR=1 FL=1